jgi:pyridoxal 5'-phosphate synthase pdxT subunit
MKKSSPNKSTPATPTKTIGVLALQGAFREHRHILERLGVLVREVRLPADLEGLSGLIIPGGESTTMAKLMMDYHLKQPIRDFAAHGGAIWGTCAGAILLAKDIENQVDAHISTASDQPRLELMHTRVRRNAFGRQVDSFQASLEIVGMDQPFKAIFIRAPVFLEVGDAVQVLSRVGDQIVLAREGKLLASSFHPELTGDPRVHQYFLDMTEPTPVPAPLEG